MKTTDTIDDLKAQYVSYFEDVPIQKYAAMAIGKDEDTLIRWRKADPIFADAVKRAKAEWVRKKILSVKAEFALERIEKEIFKPTEEVKIDAPQPVAGTGTTTELRKAFKNLVYEQIRAGKQQQE